MPEAIKCQATTNKGRPCNRWATNGSNPPRCTAHPTQGVPPGGRPPKQITPEITDTVAQAVAAGNYLEVAAAYAGISRDVLFRWLKEGRASTNPDDPAKKFSDAVDAALARAEVTDVALLARHAQKDWRAAAWRLERRAPKRWGRRDHIEHTGPDGGPIPVDATIDTANLSLEDLRTLDTILARATTNPTTDTE